MDAFEKLTRIYARIREENSEPQEQSPASVFAVRIAFEGLELPLPPVLEKLYTWHNGIYHLNAFLHFVPLREAVKAYRSFSESRRRGWLPEIKEKWFPVLDQNGDIQYCLDVETGELWAVDIEDGSIRLIAKDFEKFIDAVSEAFARDAAVYNPESGAFEVEPDDWADIRNEYGLEEP